MIQEVFAPQENSPVEKKIIAEWQKFLDDVNKVIRDAGKSEKERLGHIAWASQTLLFQESELERKKTMLAQSEYEKLKSEHAKLIHFVLESIAKMPKSDNGHSFFR